ncbi:hypothetical protein ACFVIN_01430 [Streptomyces prasinus]|uniref:hypothetical protein n=1 Tax=Streptomyces prasinus TaxID=67345 RepID=UPI003626C877
MSYPTLFITPGVRQFAQEVDAERQRQLEQFGDQRHPDGTGLPVYQHSANRYRDHTDRATAAGVLAWRDVLLEEVHEALAEKDPAKLRAELVQVAAVCAAWITDLDSRAVDEKPPAMGLSVSREVAGLVAHGAPIDIGWVNGPLEARLRLSVRPGMDSVERDQLLADLRDTIGALVPVRPAQERKL